MEETLQENSLWFALQQAELLVYKTKSVRIQYSGKLSMKKAKGFPHAWMDDERDRNQADIENQVDFL